MFPCAKCTTLACTKAPETRHPPKCPMTDNQQIIDEAKRIYQEEGEPSKIFKAAAHIEKTGYLRWSRIRELIEFSKSMGFTKLGIASCIGLREEAKTLEKILQENNFKVYPVICKFGSVSKRDVGVPPKDRFDPDKHESSCNPVGQALLLNQCTTELNIIVGLCIGHDILFTQHSQAPVTTLVVKDRVTGHNPVAGLYVQYLRGQLKPK